MWHADEAEADDAVMRMSESISPMRSDGMAPTNDAGPDANGEMPLLITSSREPGFSRRMAAMRSAIIVAVTVGIEEWRGG